jgi:Na+/H+ antiporter NhaA
MSSRVSPDDVPPATPPEAWHALLRFARLLAGPLDRFLRIEAAGAILLLVAAATALLWANSAWAEIVAGIGFTMALFIAQLAFSDSTQLAAAKLDVLIASGAAGAVGLALGRLLLAPATTAGSARSAEAESSTLA